MPLHDDASWKLSATLILSTSAESSKVFSGLALNLCIPNKNPVFVALSEASKMAPAKQKDKTDLTERNINKSTACGYQRSAAPAFRKF